MPKTQAGQLDSEVTYLDLIQEGDMLLNATTLSKRERQTASPSTSTLPLIRQRILASGWTKPTIQLAALLGLELENSLTVGGRRRLLRLMASQPVDVIIAALNRRERISLDPAFEMLRIWVNRPCPVKPQVRTPERRRIGVGYRDKGSLLPSHMKGRQLPESNAIYLGEKKEWMTSLPQQLYIWVQDWGYLMHHLGDGWWAPDIRLRQHMNAGGARMSPLG
jgi:hypothetical protein